MEVPFISSGAMSRAHYALVRKVETATSVPAADQVLLAEIETTRERLSRALSEKQTKECLVMLLYCSMTLSPGLAVNMDFALPHAVNLAEAGKTVQNKRIGYLYCAEMMPNGHELQLMLVNTLRKDIESPIVSRVCLALDVLIQSPSEDVLPAIQERLHDLLSYNSMHVRRRALYAFRALAACHPPILERVSDKISQRLRDHEPSVVIAALTLSVSLVEAGLVSADRIRGALLRLLEEIWASHRFQISWTVLLKLVEVFRIVRPSQAVCEILHKIVKTCVKHKPDLNVLLLQCFVTLASAETPDVAKAERSAKASFVDAVRHYLVSSDPNEIYLFVTCLDSIDPKLWAGTTADIRAVLEGWEVERVMQLLDSPDHSVRMKVLRVLSKVNAGIVQAYYKQSLQVDRSTMSEEELLDASRRLVEVIDILYAGDGEEYAHSLCELIQSLPTPQSAQEKQKVLQDVMEDVLTSLREAKADFRSSFLGVMFALLDDSNQTLGPTIVVILAALVCEYQDSSPVPPSRLLQGLAAQVPVYNAAIQDACLLSMTRLIASCDSVPDGVVGVVRKVQEHGGRHIRRRCDQFMNLSHSPTIVQHVIAKSKSNSLPDFLFSLESYEAEKMSQAAMSPSLSSVASPERPSSRASSTASHPEGKLRYAAYDAPKAISRLRRPRTGSPTPSDSASSRFVGEGYDDSDPMSKTITAGDLALASGAVELSVLGKGGRTPAGARQVKTPPMHPVPTEDELATRVDLIALDDSHDSPFIEEPSASLLESTSGPDFQTMWDKLSKANIRGWCESAIDLVVLKLQGAQLKMRVIPADQAPFQGDLKLMVFGDQEHPSSEKVALLRLKEGDDDSCMWHLRCEEASLREVITVALKDI